MAKLNKAEKFFKKLRDDEVGAWAAHDAMLKKFPQCLDKWADVVPKPIPPEYDAAFKLFYPNR